MRPKQPDFGSSGAEFPRVYARIPKPVSTGLENAFLSSLTSIIIKETDILFCAYSSLGYSGARS